MWSLLYVQKNMQMCTSNSDDHILWCILSPKSIRMSQNHIVIQYEYNLRPFYDKVFCYVNKACGKIKFASSHISTDMYIFIIILTAFFLLICGVNSSMNVYNVSRCRIIHLVVIAVLFMGF